MLVRTPATGRYMPETGGRITVRSDMLGMRGDQVLLRVRADDTGGKRVVSIPGTQFIARFLQHVLPAGFKRIRHYGLLAPATKAQRLQAARALLAMPQPSPQRQDDAREFMRRVAAIDIDTCTHCKLGRWQVVEALPPRRGWLADLAVSTAGSDVPATPARAPP